MADPLNELAVAIAKEIKSRHITTGWRDISAWVPGRVSGRLLFIRNLTDMVIVLDDLTVSTSGTLAVSRLPTGLRPLFKNLGDWYRSDGEVGGGGINISGGGYFNIYNTVAGQPMTGRVVIDFKPTTVFPSPYPGDPA